MRQRVCHYRASGEALVVGSSRGRCPPDVVARGSTGRRSFLVVRIQREFRPLGRNRRLQEVSTYALAKLLQQRRPLADHVTARSSRPRSQTRRRRFRVPIVVVTLLLELVVLIQAAHRAESSQNSETTKQRKYIESRSRFCACICRAVCIPVRWFTVAIEVVLAAVLRVAIGRSVSWTVPPGAVVQPVSQSMPGAQVGRWRDHRDLWR